MEALHYPWMYKAREGDKSNGLNGFEIYDSISCIAIEMAFQMYIETDESNQYRYCHFRTGSTIDF